MKDLTGKTICSNQLKFASEIITQGEIDGEELPFPSEFSEIMGYYKFLVTKKISKTLYEIKLINSPFLEMFTVPPTDFKELGGMLKINCNGSMNISYNFSIRFPQKIIEIFEKLDKFGLAFPSFIPFNLSIFLENKDDKLIGSSQTLFQINDYGYVTYEQKEINYQFYIKSATTGTGRFYIK